MKQKADLEGMRAFVAIAETKSFTGAAKRLHASKSTVSRRLDAYEQAIGSSLLRTLNTVNFANGFRCQTLRKSENNYS